MVRVKATGHFVEKLTHSQFADKYSQTSELTTDYEMSDQRISVTSFRDPQLSSDYQSSMSVLIPYHNFTVICSAGRIQHFREVMDTIQYQNKISQYRIVCYNTQTCCCTLGQSPVRLEWTETTRPCCCCWEHGSISLLPVKHCDFICDCLCIKYSLSTATVLTSIENHIYDFYSLF